MKKLFFAATAITLTVALSNCDSNVKEPKTVPVAGITINGDAVVEVGKTITLTATIMPTDATNKDITWSSLNADIATVNAQTGVVNGVKAGTATIRVVATDGSGVTETKSITVSYFGQGIGTKENPYVINNFAQLDAVRNNLDAFYKLGQDIDLTNDLAPNGAGYAKWGTAGWEPIGNNGRRFSGNFDGAGHKIKGLWINRPSTDYVGLFGCIDNATVQNLGVEVANTGIIGGNLTGGVSGFVANNGNINNCYTTGAVNGAENVGGVVGGLSNNGSINNSYATGAVNGTNNVGGIAGIANSGSMIANSFGTNEVNGSGNFVGGIVGTINNGKVTSCYAAGAVTGSNGNSVGGVVGFAYNNSSITVCAALNLSVKGVSFVGRVTGSFSSDCTLSNNWAISMTITIGGVSKTLDIGIGKADGADIPVGSINSESWWSNLFGSGWGTQWKWGGPSFPLPIPDGQTIPSIPITLPEHLEPSKTKSVSVGAQNGTLTSGTAGSVTFPITTANIANGQAATVTWYTSTSGTTTTNAPVGITASVSNLTNNVATMTMNATTAAIAGERFFKITIDGAQSGVATLTVGAAPLTKTVAVGAQNGTLTAGTAGSVTFQITTTNINNGIFSVSVQNRPSGVSVQGNITINNNNGTLTLAGSTSTTAGTTSNLTLTIDGVTSPAFAVTISPTTSSKDYGIRIEKGCVIYETFSGTPAEHQGSSIFANKTLAQRYVFTFDKYGQRARIDVIDINTSESSCAYIWDDIRNSRFQSGKWDNSNSYILNDDLSILRYAPNESLTSKRWVDGIEMPESILFVLNTEKKTMLGKSFDLTIYSVPFSYPVHFGDIHWSYGFWEGILMYYEGVLGSSFPLGGGYYYRPSMMFSTEAIEIYTNPNIPSDAFENVSLKPTWAK